MFPNRSFFFPKHQVDPPQLQKMIKRCLHCSNTRFIIPYPQKNVDMLPLWGPAVSSSAANCSGAQRRLHIHSGMPTGVLASTHTGSNAQGRHLFPFRFLTLKELTPESSNLKAKAVLKNSIKGDAMHHPDRGRGEPDCNPPSASPCHTPQAQHAILQFPRCWPQGL